MVGGILIALLPNLLLPNPLGILVGCWLCAIIGHIWEIEQVQSFKAKYSQVDILLTILGGFLIGILKFVFIN